MAALGNAAASRAATAGGNAAAVEPTRWTPDRSCPARAPQSSSSIASDGTRKTVPTRSVPSSRANRAGVGRARVSAPGRAYKALSSMVCAALVPMAKACANRSECASRSRRGCVGAPRVRLAWVATTPLGRPVVPEVYRICAMSSGRTGAGSPAIFEPDASRSGTDAVHTAAGTPAGRATPWPCNTAAAAQSASAWPSWPGESRSDSGTATPPARWIPQ
ncbi:hypothetical protein Prum_006080 [Phytohabitans rumicis]|uniref:Uncharacterized protein n=1 Tax=Phytohabitans rumicis TaxID=1076125 RepID=A0A6V8KYU0_9ACTN|nr:hypothetical protein Prum_006080 [Phytohabitans rumicis]